MMFLFGSFNSWIVYLIFHGGVDTVVSGSFPGSKKGSEGVDRHSSVGLESCLDPVGDCYDIF